MPDDHDRYVVFYLRNQSRWVGGWAVTWDEARVLGAEKLRVKSSQVWAVVVRDGETDEDALRRGIQMKGGG